MRLIIHGAGAIGSLFGAYLARAGHSVVLIGREAHVNRINQAGLKIVSAGGNFVIRLPAVTKPSEIGYESGDVIFLTTKSEDTEQEAAALAKWAPRDIPFFCFQNGVRNEEMASRSFANAYGGVVFFSGTYLSPGEIAHTRVDRVGVGAYPSGINDTARTIHETLKEAGFRAFTHDSIMAVKWSKLVVNLSMAVNAITGLSGPESAAFREPREFIADITDEGVKVIQAAGIALADEPGQPPAAERGARMRKMSDSTPDPSTPEELKHRPSTWQDLALKRGKTEVDFLNGEVVELGQRLGMATPLNELMVKVVKEMAEEGAPPGKYSVADLKRMLTD